MNPNHEIFVLFASQVGFRNSNRLPIIDALLSYPNINFNYLNITQYAENTPLDDWMRTNKLFRSSFVISHTSDVLRYLTLWKFGGTYLDLDTVSLKPLSTLNPNFAGPKAKHSSLSESSIVVGHKIAELCLKNLVDNFNGQEWVRKTNCCEISCLSSRNDLNENLQRISYSPNRILLRY
jgi:lactosylceramide 4-alpha-galactosyltransferase